MWLITSKCLLHFIFACKVKIKLVARCYMSNFVKVYQPEWMIKEWKTLFFLDHMSWNMVNIPRTTHFSILLPLILINFPLISASYRRWAFLRNNSVKIIIANEFIHMVFILINGMWNWKINATIRYWESVFIE